MNKKECDRYKPAMDYLERNIERYRYLLSSSMSCGYDYWPIIKPDPRQCDFFYDESDIKNKQGIMVFSKENEDFIRVAIMESDKIRERIIDPQYYEDSSNSDAQKVIQFIVFEIIQNNLDESEVNTYIKQIEEIAQVEELADGDLSINNYVNLIKEYFDSLDDRDFPNSNLNHIYLDQIFK